MNLSLLRFGRRLALWFAAVALAAAVPTALAQVADLSLLKLGPDTANSGANVTYKASLLNVGPNTANSVQLTDPVPGGMTFVSFTQTSGPAMSCTLPAVGATGNVDCTLASLDSGVSLTYELTLHIDAVTPPGTSLMSIATVMATELSFDPHEENNAGVAGTYVLGSDSADLLVTKLAPQTVAAGANIKYTITVTNAGPTVAAAANFSDDLTGGVNFVSLLQLSGPAFTCTTPAVGSGGTVSCNLASFGVSTAVFELTVNVPAGTPSGTTIQNTVNVISSSFDGAMENNSASVLTRVESADLTLVKTGPATAPRGGTISFDLTFANSGPDAAFATSLVDALPAGTTFVSWTQNSGPAMVCARPVVGGTGSVSCVATQFINGASAQFTLVVNALTAGNASSTAVVAAETSDPNPSGNYGASATATVAVLAPPVVSMAFAPAVVTPGQQSTLTVTLGNPAGNAAALTGVALNVTLPSGLTVASGSASACGGTLTTVAPGGISLTGGSLGVAGTCQFSATVTTATAGIYAVTTDPVSSTNGGTGATAGATLAAAVPAVISQSIVPGSIAQGTTTTMTLTLTNPNSVALSGVGFADVLPPGLQVASNPSVVNGCGGTVVATAGGNSVSLSGATMAANTSCSVSVVLLGVLPGTWTNAATANVTGLGAGNTATAAVTVYIVVPTLQTWGLVSLIGLLLVASAAGLARRKFRQPV